MIVLVFTEGTFIGQISKKGFYRKKNTFMMNNNNKFPTGSLP